MNLRALAALAATLIAWPTFGSAGEAMPRKTLRSPSTAVVATTGDEPNVLVAVPNLPEGELGVQIAALFNLQVWRTLRRAPTPPGVSFGSATAIWSHPEDPTVSTAQAADDVAERLAAQMVLWGVAHRYGDGVVVDMNLTIADEAVRRRRPSAAEWSIQIEDRRLSLMLPEGVYSFAPVVLSQRSVQTYSSPSALQLCQARRLPCRGPRVEGGMEAKLHDGPWSRVKLKRNDQIGWIYVPPLENRPDPADFTSGMVCYYRGDFIRAAEFFERVAASPASGELIRSEAAALHVAALARSAGDDVPNALLRYRGQNLESLKLHQAAVMYYLARWRALALEAARPVIGDQPPPPAGLLSDEALGAAAHHFRATAAYLDRDDPWRKGVERIMRSQNFAPPLWFRLPQRNSASSP
jgi:hypothetical protein